MKAKHVALNIEISAIAPCRKKVKPLADKIEFFLSSQNQYERAAAELAYMARNKSGRTIKEDFFKYSHLCKHVLLLLTDSNISRRLPENMQKQAGQRLERMAKFFDTIGKSEVVQAEMDLLVVKRVGINDVDVGEIEEEYQLLDMEEFSIKR